MAKRRAGEIKITCSGTERLPLAALSEFQGELKKLTKRNRERLEKQMIERGFAAPFFVWQQPEGKNYILDGHQRLRVLKSLKKQGWALPKLFPVIYVEAESEEAARRLLLGYVSAFGEATDEGLYNFMEEAGFNLTDLDEFEIPGIDMAEFSSFIKAETKAIEADLAARMAPEVELEPAEPVEYDPVSDAGYLVVSFDDRAVFDAVRKAIGMDDSQRNVTFEAFVQALDKVRY